MTIAELIALTRARLSYLNGQRVTASALGDAVRLADLDAQIATTERTIAALEAI